LRLKERASSRLLDFLTVSRLALQKKGLWMPTLSAKLKRPEVLVPSAFWDVGGMQPPFLQGKEVFQRDVAFFRAVEEVPAQLSWQV